MILHHTFCVTPITRSKLHVQFESNIIKSLNFFFLDEIYTYPEGTRALTIKKAWHFRSLLRLTCRKQKVTGVLCLPRHATWLQNFLFSAQTHLVNHIHQTIYKRATRRISDDSIETTNTNWFQFSQLQEKTTTSESKSW